MSDCGKKKVPRYFDRNRIDNLFNFAKNYVKTKDEFYILRRIEQENRYEFRLETDYLTLKKFFIDKDFKAKSNLIKKLKEMDLFVEYYSILKRGQIQ